MSDTPEKTVAEQLTELESLLSALTQTVTSIPTGLDDPIPRTSLETIRFAAGEAAQEAAVTAARAAALSRLKVRQNECKEISAAMEKALLRLNELLQLVRHVRGEAMMFSMDGAETKNEIEHQIENALRKSPPGRPASKSKLQAAVMSA